MRGNLYRVSTVHCAEILSLPDVLDFDWSGEAAFAKVHFDAHCAVVVTVEYADCFRSVAEGPAPYLDRPSALTRSPCIPRLSWSIAMTSRFVRSAFVSSVIVDGSLPA